MFARHSSFLYSQDLSNYKTSVIIFNVYPEFLYSQDLSNYKTADPIKVTLPKFLYSQDLSNYKTYELALKSVESFCILKI